MMGASAAVIPPTQSSDDGPQPFARQLKDAQEAGDSDAEQKAAPPTPGPVNPTGMSRPRNGSKPKNAGKEQDPEGQKTSLPAAIHGVVVNPQVQLFGDFAFFGKDVLSLPDGAAGSGASPQEGAIRPCAATN